MSNVITDVVVKVVMLEDRVEGLGGSSTKLGLGLGV